MLGFFISILLFLLLLCVFILHRTLHTTYTAPFLQAIYYLKENLVFFQKISTTKKIILNSKEEILFFLFNSFGLILDGLW